MPEFKQIRLLSPYSKKQEDNIEKVSSQPCWHTICERTVRYLDTLAAEPN